jgi:hypothetical protein
MGSTCKKSIQVYEQKEVYTINTDNDLISEHKHPYSLVKGIEDSWR